MTFAPVLDTELIFSTLFSLLESAYQFTTTSRLLQHWSDVPATMQPALYMTQISPTVKQSERQPDIWTLGAMVWIYAQAPDQESSADPKLNFLVDAIRSVLQPNGADAALYGVNTLNKLVSRVWIEGKIELDEGYLGGQAVARIPLKLTWPPQF